MNRGNQRSQGQRGEETGRVQKTNKVREERREGQRVMSEKIHRHLFTVDLLEDGPY